jgi:hypothetical protein
MIEIIISKLQHKVLSLIILVFISLILRQTLIISKQYWAKSFSHTSTFILLPIITYCITSVISGNLALSLGMVGALSIVRFRNPVRSPFELSIYFLLISLGVCASVNTQWLLFLGTSSILIIFLLEIYRSYYFKKFKKNVFTMSFNEGNNLNNLEVHSEKNIEELDSSDLLTYKSFDNELYQYRLSSLGKEELLKYFENYREKKEIKYINFMSS